ncbi:MAG: hypothetical protein JWN46_2952 [Acidimicrobiales bacterium]|nr:hypothetical protein [Acidimicrobiales bacterium]
MPHPLDEYPLHQVPLSMAHVASSDRNAYDRCYFNAHDRTGELFLVTGLGVYPNLGVVDAFATVRTGDRQVSVRTSGDLDRCDRLAPSVGPYRVEVVEPLERIRIVCDGDDLGVGFDLTWTGSFPAVEEAPHVWRSGPRITLDAQRFAQVGTWEGSLRVEGTEIAVTPDRWLGTRDRSWGIRPTGEPEPAGRSADSPVEGFWWLYVPLRFDDFAVIVIVQEDPDGHRVLNEATRVWPAATGRRPEQLGWPEVDVHYQSGTRIPTGATIVLRERGGRPLELEVESLGYVALNAGSGYGGDPSWSHGTWKGEGWVDGAVHDLHDPAVSGMVPFGVIDHVGRATLDGAEGWGLFEHASMGRHDPSGFVDYSSVAP